MNIRTKLYAIFMGIAALFVGALVWEDLAAHRKMLLAASRSGAEAAADLAGDIALQCLVSQGARHCLSEKLSPLSGVRRLGYLQVADADGRGLFVHARPGLKISGRAGGPEGAGEGLFGLELDLVKDDRVYGKLRLGVTAEPVRASMENYVWRGLFRGGAVLGILAVMLWAASSKLAGDMRMLADAGDRIQEPKVPPLPSAEGGSDVGRISAAFRGLHDAIAEEKNLRRESEELSHDFFAMTVHDLKQPITVLKAAHQLMEGALPDGGSGKTDLERISYLAKDSLNRLNGMVEDILNITKLSDRSVPVQKERIELGSLLKECEAENSVIVSASGRKWSFEAGPGAAESCIFGDDVLIRRVIGNLVLNAIHYTPEGGEIKLGARLRGGDALELFVSDEGVGIPDKFRQEIFRKYTSLSRTAKNVGLGLAFCKLVAERHSAEIEVHSTRGKGTVISLIIPLCGRESTGRHEAAPAGKV